VWKFEGLAPPKGQDAVSWKSPLRMFNVNAYNFFVSGPMFTKFLEPNRGGFAVDNAVFKVSLRRSIAEICAIKVESCQKLSWIFDVFALPNFVGGDLPKLVCPLYYQRHESHHLVKFREVMTTTRKVIGVNTLNFKPSFKCSPSTLLRRPPLGLWCALANLGQSLERVKISGSCTP